MTNNDFSWKRIQTIFIAAAGLLLLAMLACDMCFAMVPKEGAAGVMERFTIKFTERYQFLIFSFTTFALTIVTIGYWKQRIIQMRLCILNSIMLFFYQIWIIVEFFKLHKVFTFTIASVFPAIAIILLLVALKFIGRDEINFTVANAMAGKKGGRKAAAKKATAIASMLLMLVSCGKQESVDWAEGIHDIPDLAGKKVCVLSGALQDFMLEDLDPKPTIQRFASPAELLVAVESGQSDYCLTDTVAFIGAGAEERGLEFVFSSEMVAGPYGFAFRKEDSAIQAEFNVFLQRYRDDGRYADLEKRWTSKTVLSEIMPEIPMNENGEVLRIGMTNFFPFSFIQNGKEAGLEIEILETFASETGRRAEFQMMDFSAMIAALMTNKIDVVAAGMTITEERSRQVLFSDPYFYCRSACYCRNEQETALAHKPFGAKIKDSFYNNLILEDRWKIIADGLWETIVISIFAILFGTIFGGFLCWMLLSGKKVLRKTADIYVDIIRGVPILVLLMLMFYVVFADGGISARWVAVIAFAMNFGAYVSQMFRTGIESVDKGQTEAGLAMGFTRLGTFVNFVVPQALKQIIPVFKGEAVSLIKNTSVVGFIAIQDLTKASEIIRARTFDAFFPLIIISIIYFILAWLLGKALDGIVNKMA